MAALSFCYAPPVSGQYAQHINKDEATTISNLQSTCKKIMAARNCQISLMSTKTKQTNSAEFNLSLTGSAQAIMEARGDLLLNCPLEIMLTLQIQPNANLSLLNDHCRDLEKEFDTKITIVPEKASYSSLISDNAFTVEITGNPIQVEQCRVRVLVAIDEIMYAFKTEIVRLPLKLQYLICGRKRAGLLPIIEETSTNIYFPSPFTHHTETKNTNNEEEKDFPIYITGEQVHVLRVKDMLNKLAVQKAKSMYHKDTALYARKIDWLLLHRRDELRKIMHDNGAYIEFPTLGSGDNRVTVYAENRVNAERTLRALNFQACSIYEACFFFNNDDGAIYDPTGSHNFFESTTNLSSLVSQLSQVSGSEVFYKTDPGCIEVLGAERAIRNVYQRLQEMQFLQVFHQYTVFRVESSNEQRDFISGKKNGKINKIMKTSGAKIRFVSFINDYNFIIEVESTSFTKALDGLTLLQEELPAEISFYVPESYHKRIIGVGGKNIQRIMKKYGVYVKFSNTEEFASLGGYYNNEDNVVARTPMKNQINLDNLRHAVMELIHPKDRDYMVDSILIPFHLHRLLIHDYQDTFITEELIKKTNTHVLWPDAELASNTVELLGPEAHMSMAFKMMESIVPEAYDLHFPTSTAFHEAIQSDLFQKKVVSVLDQDYQVSVETSAPTSDRGGFIRLNMTRDRISLVLQDALRVVIDYLNSQKVPLLENTTAEQLFHAVEKKQQLTAKKGNLIASSSSSLLDSTLLKHPPTASSMLNSVSMMRSSTDTVYIAPFNQKQTNASPPSLTPAQPTQFFNFNNDTPLDNSGWMSSLAPSVQPQPIPSTSLQSNGSGNSAGGDTNNNTNSHLRAIFDAPMELTEQERAVLSNYRYQRMNMPPPPSNFGFPQAVPSAPTSDIWSAPTTQISGNRRSASTAFSPNTMTSPPSSHHRATTTTTTTTYAQSVTNENANIRRYNEASTGGGNKVFYPSMHIASNEFNPYNDSPTLKSSQSMPEPMLEAHFSSSRPNFQTSPSFHGNQAQAFGQIHLGNYRPTSSGSFVPQNTPPKHEQQQQQFFTNTNELNVVQKVFENLSTQSSGSSGYDPRRQKNHDQEKGSRPPPGIDI